MAKLSLSADAVGATGGTNAVNADAASTAQDGVNVGGGAAAAGGAPSSGVQASSPRSQVGSPGSASASRAVRSPAQQQQAGAAPAPQLAASQALQALQNTAAAAAQSTTSPTAAPAAPVPRQPSNSGKRGGEGAVSQVNNEDEEEIVDEEDEEESSEVSGSDEDGSWIDWFCSLRGNEFFCEVDEDYIQDDFNLTGLNVLVPYYDYALDMVLDVEMPMEDSLTEEQQELVESAAEMLYGLIHARYIVTNRGMHAMYEKYRAAAFGRCPHVFCQGQPVLPVGLSDLPRNYTVNIFCPRCHGLFFPKSTRQANIDGAYFGTTFPHLYLMTHPDMVPAKPTQVYHPRVYGFKVAQSSLYYRNREESQQQQQQIEGNQKERRRSSRYRNGRK